MNLFGSMIFTACGEFEGHCHQRGIPDYLTFAIGQIFIQSVYNQESQRIFSILNAPRKKQNRTSQAVRFVSMYSPCFTVSSQRQRVNVFSTCLSSQISNLGVDRKSPSLVPCYVCRFEYDSRNILVLCCIMMFFKLTQCDWVSFHLAC